MSTLPPSSTTLKLLAKRANFVSGIWKRSGMQHINEPCIALHGWHNDGTSKLVEDEFPADIIDILVDSAYNEDDVYGYKADSDIED